MDGAGLIILSLGVRRGIVLLLTLLLRAWGWGVRSLFLEQVQVQVLYRVRPLLKKLNQFIY